LRIPFRQMIFSQIQFHQILYFPSDFYFFWNIQQLSNSSSRLPNTKTKGLVTCSKADTGVLLIFFSFSDVNVVGNWQWIDERIEMIKTLNYNELSTQPCWKSISNEYSIIIKDFGEKSWKKVLALIGDKSLYKNYSNCKRKLGKTNLPPKLKSSPNMVKFVPKHFFFKNLWKCF
jgi:hypothetical protein